jgi:hypothetical protein
MAGMKLMLIGLFDYGEFAMPLLFVVILLIGIGWIWCESGDKK